MEWVKAAVPNPGANVLHSKQIVGLGAGDATVLPWPEQEEVSEQEAVPRGGKAHPRRRCKGQRVSGPEQNEGKRLDPGGRGVGLLPRLEDGMQAEVEVAKAV
jgi:hypothetical protein